jgi:transcriptional regulator with XRE-family HTH domain
MGTPGGVRLRALREATGRTQLWVEAEADLGTGYLQRLESGRVAQPERGTLERILNALEARYGERKEVLERFGYLVPTPPPSAQEIAWARAVCRRELDELPFPALALDCAHRLVAWNRLLPRLLGVGSDDPLVRRLARGCFLIHWLDPVSPLAELVAEPDVFLPAMIRAFRYEMEKVGNEPWATDLLDEARRFPRFVHYAAVADRAPATASAARVLVPLRLNVPGAGLLEFRVSAEPFTRDPRFRLVSYLPADPASMRRCAAWAAEMPPDASD